MKCANASCVQNNSKAGSLTHFCAKWKQVYHSPLGMRASGAGETEMHTDTASGSRWAKVMKQREAAGTVADTGCTRIHLPDKGVCVKKGFIFFFITLDYYMSKGLNKIG